MAQPAPIEQHLERATQAVAKQLLRIYEGLEQLAAITVAVFQDVPAEPAEVDAWAAAELVVDADGYYARERVLRQARAGEISLDEAVFYVHAGLRDDPAVRRHMFQLRRFGPRLRRIHARLDGVAWIYYQGPQGWAMSYPMHDPTPTIPADFDWRGYLTYRSVEPAANPERAIRWTPPNIDYGGKGLMVTPSIPIYLDDDRFAGLWSMDVPVSHLLQGAQLDLDLPGQEIFIVDADGLLIAHRRIATVIDAGKGSASRESITSLGGDLAALDVGELLREGRGRRELRAADGAELVCVHQTIPELDWVVVATFPAESLLERVRTSFREAFTRLGAGDVGYRIEADLGGELQALVDGYNEMAGTLERTLAERAEEQQALQRSQRVQAIGQLAGGIAHDFNNLLTAITGAASLLELNGVQGEELEVIQTATQRAAALTHQLLAFSRRDVTAPRPLDLSEVLAEGRDLLRRLLPEGIALVFQVPDGLPPVIADPTQMLQLVLNLVVNARDAVGPTGTIEVAVRLRDGMLAVTVRDDGAGMSDEVLRRARDPFFTTKATGTGLGLATVQQIVDDLGGRVELTSEPAVGTTVTLLLPPAEASPDAKPPSLESSAPTLEGWRILVLDDDRLVRETTVRVLRRLGAQAEGCRNTATALERLAAAPWDLFLTDVVMPDGGGREAARRARERVPTLKVLFMSGYTDDALLSHGFRVADEQFLRKPFTPSQLVDAVRAKAPR